MRPAIFLDRDDTLMEANALSPPPPPGSPGDVVDPALVKLLPGAKEGCERLKKAGFALVVVSNQGVVARGAGTMQQVQAVNARLAELLGGNSIDAFYFCPFHPKGNVPEFTREHPWRKPAPGMILAAAAELELDLSESWLIGDAARDIESGLAAGLPRSNCLLLGHDTPNLLSAATHICK